MKNFYDEKILKKYKGSALAIGNFDGVHRGHQKVFRYAKKIAKKKSIKFGILTFNPLPIMFFNKNEHSFIKCNYIIYTCFFCAFPLVVNYTSCG